MALNCDPNALAQLAKCFKCLSPATLEEIQTFLLCQIANNGTGGGGGGGSGVTTFRSAWLDWSAGFIHGAAGLQQQR